MKYYLDTEFDATTNEIITLGMVSEENVPLYIIFACDPKDDWVIEHVVPYIKDVPVPIHFAATHSAASKLIEDYFKHDPHPHVLCDWPTDFAYLSELLTDGHGNMIAVPAITMEVTRVDPWPNEILNAVQHNAYWDAIALKHLLTGAQTVPAEPIDITLA